MTAFPWKIIGKSTMRSGVVEAASDREALAKVLGGEVGFSPVPTESYSITVGPLTTSAYGDEFSRVAGSTKIDETQLDPSKGFLFDDPVRKQLEERAREFVYPGVLADQMRRALQPCPANRGGQHSFNLDSHIRKGDAGIFKHGRCTCGAVTPTPVSTEQVPPSQARPTPVRIPTDQPMSESLRKQFEKLDAIGQEAVRARAQKMMDELIARAPVDTGIFRRPTIEEGKSQQAPSGIIEGAIRRAMDADLAHKEERARARVIHLASMATKGTWLPHQATRITRREDMQCVDVEFSDGQCMETIRLTDKEIILARF